jgi:hypothetical protein
LAAVGPAYAQNAAVTVDIDAQRNRRAINPNIYGIAQAGAAVIADLNVTINRYGGNNATRYNWKLNADNRGSDWYFESVADPSAIPGERGDSYIANSRAGGAEPMITIPLIGYVGYVGSTRTKLASFSIKKYGAQTGADYSWYPDAGNGILKSTGKPVVGNNPLDANVASNSAYQNGWVQQIVGKWGTAANGGLRYYILDNEPSIWYNTHRDVQPVGVKMDEMKSKTIEYARMIRSNDPGALIVGPEEWGWSGYLYSGYDLQYGAAHGWGSLPDRSAHGGWDYVPWLLDQLRQNDAATGVRSLDVFSLHYYPQSGEFGSDTSTTMQLLRNKSTRSLWDPNYVDQSWINAKVQLIPRMKSWVAAYYPGLQTAITEYNWGAENHINGATAQADIWGIFGREGLDLAARWTYPGSSTPTYKAMKLYRNYDGKKSTFGDTSVYAAVPNPDNLSAFAATRASDGALTVMVVNKVLTGTTPVTLNLAGFTTNGSAQVWQLTSANAINRLSDVAATTTVSLTLPPQSVTLLVCPRGTTPAPAAPTNLGASAGDSQVSLSWTASTGATSYNIKRATTTGGPYTTVKSGNTTTSYTDTGLTNGTKYFYVVTAVNLGGESGSSNEASATPSAPTAAVLRINSGGPLYSSTTGVFEADKYFTSGQTVDRGGIAISGTSDPALYRTIRYNPSFGYSIPVANGNYTLTLHFAETGYKGAGIRKFKVNVNGSTWLSSLDVFAEAGWNKALKKSTTVTVTNGKIDLSFASLNSLNSFVNAIEVAPAP